MAYLLRTKPWKHQLQALDYLITSNYGALYTDMGSGKTKIMIDLINNKDLHTILIVATTKGCEVWEDEFETHSYQRSNLWYNLQSLSTTDKVSMLESMYPKRQISTAKRVIIVNYESVWREPFSTMLMRKSLNIDCIICDESHKIKAPRSKVSMFLAKLGKRSKYRYLMTGTPTPESPADVYAQYKFLNPEIFGVNFGAFKERYFNFDLIKSTKIGFPILDKKNPYKNLDDLKKKMFSCAVTASGNVKLPKVTHLKKYFNLSQETIDIYKEVRKTGVYEDAESLMETNTVLTRILREQQILSGYLPVESLDFTEKIDKILDTRRSEALRELLEGIPPNENVVIFAKFRYDFESIKSVCKELKRKYGEISGKQNDYGKWKKGKINTIAVHYQSGSESIDLTRARYCIYYSLSHSYGQYKQSKKRVHRNNQKRPVTYYKIYAKIPKIKTVDEDILMALKRKKDTVDYIMKRP